MSVDQPRQPAGTPTGGRFATTTRREGGVVLVTNPPGAETSAKEAVTAELLEQYPTAVSWKVGTTDWDDGWFFDESNVEVTYRNGTTLTSKWVDLSQTVAADALREVADEQLLGRYSQLDVTIPALPGEVR